MGIRTLRVAVILIGVMPSGAALITMLIIDRPLCLDCIAERTNMSVPRVEEYLGVIRGSLTVYHEAYDRCRACGRSAKVVSLDQPL